MVCDKWKNYFKSLLNPTNDQNFDYEFLTQKLTEKELLEINVSMPNLPYHNIINDTITFEEVKAQKGKLRNKKASGPDGIKNEILKIEGINYLLFNTIKYSFDKSIIPVVWRQADIKPIPKDDKKTPLHHLTIEA